ncbi:MAG: KilA-N domain-containing protein [Mycoplasmataceae bacterium]|nr:KilA-N domain-containing protein [Mycoplasmataceae bacterium]
MIYSFYSSEHNKHINFRSEIVNDYIEMFNITQILKQIDFNCDDFEQWIKQNHNTLNYIDNIVSIDNDNFISENTYYHCKDGSYVNINVIIEFISNISKTIMHEILSQIMYDKIHNQDNQDNDDDNDDIDEE